MTAENKANFMLYVGKRLEEKKHNKKFYDDLVNDYIDAKSWRFKKMRGCKK